MKILIVTYREIVQLLPMRECISVMEEALIALARGQVYQPLRMVVRPQDAAGLMGLMPAYRAGAHPAFGLKTICVFPENPAKGKDAHQGSVMLFDGETGEMRALMNASAITAIRTAAVSAVATKLLAREDANDLAIVGAGVQARTHLAAMACVRPLRRARIVSRTLEHAQQLVEEFRAAYSFPIEAVANVEEALLGADLIVTATSAHEPVLKREWITNGAHINAVGAYSSATREIDTATLAASLLFVDRRESAINEAGDYLLALEEGAIGPEHIRAEIGELLTGAKPGRTLPGQITLFKSLGLAVEDLAAAEYIYQQAKSAGVGTWVEF
ncbi:MAG TPA: ornithine cyclodeaminase family protein [Pyrinomonadaceae bacterium]|nr:ornithine cyclodeaminase family protein [Pyrinomonadaceae bacterium]